MYTYCSQTVYIYSDSSPEYDTYSHLADYSLLRNVQLVGWSHMIYPYLVSNVPIANRYP